MGRLVDRLDELDQLVIRGEIDALRPFYAPDAEFRKPGVPAGTGLDAELERLRQVVKAYRFHEIRITWAVETDDSVAAELWYSLEDVATHRRAEFPAMAMLKFRDGLVTVEHECFDMQDARSQLQPQLAT